MNIRVLAAEPIQGALVAFLISSLLLGSTSIPLSFKLFPLPAGKRLVKVFFLNRYYLLVLGCLMLPGDIIFKPAEKFIEVTPLGFDDLF
jgi:hypothetical protein